jgi:hypothetical protein
LSGVVALGVDEIHVGRKEKFWTLIYQFDEPCKRLLWVGREVSEVLCLGSVWISFGWLPFRQGAVAVPGTQSAVTFCGIRDVTSP